MPRAVAIGAFIISALTVPVAVFASDSKIDPHSSSPAGAVYEIPLQTARGYGSPGGGTPSGGGSGGGGVLPQGSAIKSENGYGSSSRIPGLNATAPRGAKASAKASAGAGGAAGTAAAATATGGAAKLGAEGWTSYAPLPQVNARAAASNAPSLGGTYGLVALIAVGGAAAGIAAAMAARRALG